MFFVLINSLIFAGALVERVVLLGAPIPIKDVNWEAARKVKFFTVFHDIHLLDFVFEAAELKFHYPSFRA